MLDFSQDSKRSPPPRLDIDLAQRYQGREDPKTPPGPITPSRSLAVSTIPETSLPQPTRPPLKPSTPPDTPPRTPTNTSIPDGAFPFVPSLSLPSTNFSQPTRVSISGIVTPTDTVFVTAAPQTVRVTAIPTLPTMTNPNGNKTSPPLQPPPASKTGQGMSFTTASGVVVMGVVGGIGKNTLPLVA
ncbi:hypothetical protein CTRI78_v005198 [Colletotrichum trifolii]|uniref:Uncharacterized protein n=1 Tax=Colletotrichum trifolii TaxID=5466 RepID=A0A4R8RF67_COLTR|nr:hypothetical protein CTRI78_v005198 [Colletotrichum trifolii]